MFNIAHLSKSVVKGQVSIRPFSWLKPICFKLFVLSLICIDCVMVQYQILWFTCFCCMHDLSGWGNSTPFKSIETKMLFFYFKFMLQNGGCNRKRTLVDLKDDDNIVMKFVPG